MLPEGLKLSPELITLCKLVHARNELQAMRHSARTKRRRYAHALSYLQSLNRWKGEVKFCNPLTNPDMKKIMQVLDLTSKPFGHYLHNIYQSAHDAKKCLTEEIVRRQAHVKVNEPYRNPSISDKMLKLGPRKLMVLEKEWHVKLIQAELAIHKHTDAHSVHCRKLMAGLYLRPSFDHSNMTSFYLRTGTTNKPVWINRETIGRIAAGEALENAVYTQDQIQELDSNYTGDKYEEA